MTLRRLFAVLGLALLVLGLSGPRALAQDAPRRVLIYLIHDVSVEDIVVGLDLNARGAEVGLLTNADELVSQAAQLSADSPEEVVVEDLRSPARGDAESAISAAALQIESDIFFVEPVIWSGEDQLVIVATVQMQSSGDRLGAVMLFLAPSTGEPGVLTSSSTRRTGVVDGNDLRPTVAAFLGLPGESHDGAYVVAESNADLLVLHEKYLAQRRMYVPVAIVAGIFTGIVVIGGLLIYFKRQRSPRWLLAVGRWMCFAIPALGLALLAAGHLPKLNYASVTPFLVGVTLLLPAFALAFRRRGTLVPPLVFGLLILAFFLVEALTGWGATMFTLLGGTALDGGRFYGLPNAFEGLLVGSAVYVAASLKPSRGLGVILAVAIFMGLPWFGADLGGAVVALVAAGLWFSLRVRGRFGWKEAGLTLLTVVAGMVVILAAHRIFASTHGTAFVEAEVRSPFHILSVAWDRLAVGIRLLQRNPVGIIYLAATPVLLWAVAKPRGGLKVAFDENPVWHHAMLALLCATVVAYFVNDTGVSAVGLGFAMALGGTIYVPLAREPAKMVSP